MMENVEAKGKQARPDRPIAGETTHRSGLSEAIAVATLSLGTFAFVSTELMPIGILPSIAKGVNVSLGQAGFLVTGFAFIVALAAAPLTAATSRWNRKRLILSLLLVCTIGNILTYFSANYAMLLASRLIVAAAIGIFWSTAAGIAVRIVPERHAVRATSAVYGGLALASVLGIPAGTFLGNYVGWRVVFIALGILSFAVFGMMWSALPNLKPRGDGKRTSIGEAWNEPSLRMAVIVTDVVMTANFLAFTYITPFLEDVVGFHSSWISALLLAYGVAGLMGNFGIAPIMGRGYRPTLLVVLAGLTLSLLALTFVTSNRPAVIVLLLIWGATYSALPVLMQTWVFKAANHLSTPDSASSLYVAAYNGAIAIGALAGGLVVDHFGSTQIMVIAAIIGACSIPIAARYSPR